MGTDNKDKFDNNDEIIEVDASEGYEAPESPDGEKKEMKKAAGMVKIGIILVAIALIGVGVMWYYNWSHGSDQQAQIDSLTLANEKLLLQTEYENLNAEFQQYENQAQYLQNDSLLEQYNQAKDKAEKLLAELKSERATNGRRIKELQGEINTLKGLLRHYVTVIDSLSRENSALKDENQQLQSQNAELSSTVNDYSEKNQRLNERMQLAEKLNLTGLQFSALNKKGKNEKKINKAKQLVVTFTIPQNNSTPVGEKTFFVRIVTPEGNVLGSGRTFPFEGGNVAYTEKKTIEYDQQETTLTLYHNVTTALTKGSYTVEVFVDNYRLVSRQFAMEK